MDDNTPKMLQAILNGQRALKEELSNRIDRLAARIDKLEIRIDQLDKKLTKRFDRLGKQLSYLEDDTPTREEHDNLVSRVEKLEHQFTSAQN